MKYFFILTGSIPVLKVKTATSVSPSSLWFAAVKGFAVDWLYEFLLLAFLYLFPTEGRNARDCKVEERLTAVNVNGW